MELIDSHIGEKHLVSALSCDWRPRGVGALLCNGLSSDSDSLFFSPFAYEGLNDRPPYSRCIHCLTKTSLSHSSYNTVSSVHSLCITVYLFCA